MNLCHYTGHFYRLGRTDPLEWRCRLCGKEVFTDSPPLRWAGTFWKYVAALPWMWSTYAVARRASYEREAAKMRAFGLKPPRMPRQSIRSFVSVLWRTRKRRDTP